MMYLMRSKHWSAQKAREYVVQRRSIVCPNDGFWRTLCSLEAGLGIIDRWVMASAAPSRRGGGMSVELQQPHTCSVNTTFFQHVLATPDMVMWPVTL